MALLYYSASFLFFFFNSIFSKKFLISTYLVILKRPDCTPLGTPLVYLNLFYLNLFFFPSP